MFLTNLKNNNKFCKMKIKILKIKFLIELLKQNFKKKLNKN